MRLIHWEATKRIRRIEVTAMQDHARVLHEKARKSTFINAAKEVLSHAMDTSKIAEFGLDAPLRGEVDMEWFESKLEQSYQKVVESVTSKAKADRDKAAQKVASKRQVDAELSEAKPAELLKTLIRSECNNLLKENSIMTDADVDLGGGEEDNFADKVLHSLQGNGASPGGGQGQNHQKKRVGKGGKSSGKSKGKGHGQGNQSKGRKGKGKEDSRSSERPLPWMRGTSTKPKGSGKDKGLSSASSSKNQDSRKGSGKGKKGYRHGGKSGGK